MPQSSLTAWLRKPAAVKEAPGQIRCAKKHTIGDAVETLPTTGEDISPTRTPAEPKEEVTYKIAATSNNEVSSINLSDVAAKPPLPPNVHFRSCTKEDIPQLKRMTGLLLPVAYPESFYREIITDPLTNNITLLAFWHDHSTTAIDNGEKGRLVGAIRCRILTDPQARQNAAGRPNGQVSKPMLYLSTLVLLAPYRSYGIASHLLEVMMKRAIEDYGIGSVGAHVWEANEALEWYRKRGFKEVGREKEYYRKLKPQGAVVVRRDVSVMDLLSK